MLWGTAWIIGACLYWNYLFGNPLEELALINRGQTARGFIIETSEDILDSDQGSKWVSQRTYNYRLPDGREFAGKTGDIPGQLKGEIKEPYAIEVEYLPDNPVVSRIKGYGNDTVRSWMWHNVVSVAWYFS